MAVGYNNFDMAAFNAANVLGTNTPDVLNEIDRRLRLGADDGGGAPHHRIASTGCARANGRSGAYDGFLGTDIYGSTLGVIGMGRIGQALARRATRLQHAGDLSQPLARRAARSRPS